MGLLDGNAPLDERIADIVVKVFDRYDIEPGELNKKMSDTIEIVQELAPVVRELEDLSHDLDNDVSRLREDLTELQEVAQEFGDHSNELANELERTADAFQNFNEIIEEATDEGDD